MAQFEREARVSIKPDERSRLLTENQAAQILGVNAGTLRRWRWSGEGPEYLRIGRRAIRYESTDLEAFIAAGRTERATNGLAQ